MHDLQNKNKTKKSKMKTTPKKLTKTKSALICVDLDINKKESSIIPNS